MKPKPSPEPTGEPADENLTQSIPWQAILAYLPLFCLYPWSIRHRVPGLAPHAKQGLILFAVEIILLLIRVPVFYRLLWLGIIVLALVGAWHAYSGRVFRLPILSDLADKLVWERIAAAREEKNPPTTSKE